jgi:hypothetical protein
LKSETIDLKSETIDLKSETIDLKSETIDLKSETIGLKSETIGLKSETIGMKAATIGLKAATIGMKAATIGMKAATIGLKAATIGLKAATIGLKFSPKLPYKIITFAFSIAVNYFAVSRSCIIVSGREASQRVSLAVIRQGIIVLFKTLPLQKNIHENRRNRRFAAFGSPGLVNNAALASAPHEKVKRTLQNMVRMSPALIQRDNPAGGKLPGLRTEPVARELDPAACKISG